MAVIKKEVICAKITYIIGMAGMPRVGIIGTPDKAIPPDEALLLSTAEVLALDFLSTSAKAAVPFDLTFGKGDVEAILRHGRRFVIITYKVVVVQSNLVPKNEMAERRYGEKMHERGRMAFYTAVSNAKADVAI